MSEHTDQTHVATWEPLPTPEERIEILERRVADLERLTEGLLKEHHRWRQWMEGWPR